MFNERSCGLVSIEEVTWIVLLASGSDMMMFWFSEEAAWLDSHHLSSSGLPKLAVCIDRFVCLFFEALPSATRMVRDRTFFSKFSLDKVCLWNENGNLSKNSWAVPRWMNEKQEMSKPLRWIRYPVIRQPCDTLLAGNDCLRMPVRDCLESFRLKW